ncbi:MAG: hypothetical protein ACM3ZT_01230 [Bacillota bacterium]
MRPLTFINGVILGSAGALGAVMGVILFFRWTMTGDPTLDQTVVQSDLPVGEILRYMCIFTGLSLVALTAFWAELRQRSWRQAADFVLAVTLCGVLIWFFADPDRRFSDLVLLAAIAAVLAVVLTTAVRLGLVARVTRWLGD